MTEHLSHEERQRIAEDILEGRKIPAKYLASLVEEPLQLELIWPGKSDLHELPVLPFQSIEHIDEPRLEPSGSLGLFELDDVTGRQSAGWGNKLIWGDNRAALASLIKGPLQKDIQDAGGLKLVYIDPPFDVGADFSIDIAVGEETVTKRASVIEQFAYRDTWGRGQDSYVNMVRDRLILLRNLMAPDSSIFVHVDWRVNSAVRLILDEVFGSDAYRNEIAWCYSGPANTRAFLPRKHDSILFYAKGSPVFHQPRIAHKSGVHNTGQLFKANAADANEEKQAEMEQRGKAAEDWWVDVYAADRYRKELLGYPTQKPEALIRRILEMASEEGDLVADFFCGSGTTLAVAEKLQRKWIGVDLGRFAIHTSRKRLISVQRERASKGLSYRSFEILNIGGYERKQFLPDSESENPNQKEQLSASRRDAFVELVSEAYGATPASQAPPFHALKGDTAVFIGEVNEHVSEFDIDKCLEAAESMNLSKVDILGFEFEMGITPVKSDEAKVRGINLSLRYIPEEVFQKSVVEQGRVEFYEVGYLEADLEVRDGGVIVKLADFGVFYRQQDADLVGSELSQGGSKLVVDQGQVVRVSKSKEGIISKEFVTSTWTDWVDYWSIDFNFGSKPETVRVLENDIEVSKATGRYVFENEWQSFRESKPNSLDLTSQFYSYLERGSYKIAVKVIDIFGNDTTRVFEVKV